MQARFIKVLSRTDVSAARTHQDGILVPHGDARRRSGVFPLLDASLVNPEAPLTISVDGAPHAVRFVYYNTRLQEAVPGSRNEYRIVPSSAILESLGAVGAGDVFVLERDHDEFNAYKSARAWLLLAPSGNGNSGEYRPDEDMTSTYVWGSNLPNATKVRVGDPIVVADSHGLIGFSLVEAIQQTTDRGVVSYQATYGKAWHDAPDALSGDELGALVLPRGAKGGIRQVDWDGFVQRLDARGFSDDTEVVEQALLEYGGKTTRLSNTRLQQGKFRAETLASCGEVCAVTGPTPKDALDAAHLYNFAEVGTHHRDGGIMLRKDIHALFDKGQIAIDPHGWTIELSKGLQGEPTYAYLQGHDIHGSLNSRQEELLSERWTRSHPHAR